MKHEVITFGCRLNSYESEVMKQALDKSNAKNDVFVFNSCAVTKEAERQLRQSIRKKKRDNPSGKIIVTGCAAQIDPDKYVNMQEVDLVLGNQEKFDAGNYDLELATQKAKVNDIMSVKETAGHLIASFEGRSRAFLQVQNGCNHRCTFCIIPYGRGNSRSVPVGEIVNQAQTLVDSGYSEIVITGVDITDYGLDLPGKPSLGQMLKRLLKLVPDLPRIRLSSIDVAEIDNDLYDLITTEPRIMPYMHISLQAGDNMILKRMKRRHTREQVIEFCHKVRDKRPEISFGADIIAGFPTETDEMFENTYNLAKEADLQFLHVFPYSIREGTPAAKMPQVDGNIKKLRANKLRELGKANLARFLKNKIGKESKVVVEKHDIGRDQDFCEVSLDKTCKVGDIVKVNFTGVDDKYMLGKVI